MITTMTDFTSLQPNSFVGLVRLQMPINVHILQYKNMISIFRIFVGKIDVVCAWFFINIMMFFKQAQFFVG